MTAPLPYDLSGNKSSDKIIVFLHGWPDLPALWDKVIPEIEQTYYILNVSYPNYSPEEKYPKGNDFEQIGNRIKATIDLVNDTKRKVVVVSHDWGAVFGYYLDYLYPNYVSEMVALDVGPGFSVYRLYVMFYQFILIIAFFIGGFIGKLMSIGISRLFFKHSPPYLNKIEASWNYPYWYFWKKIIKSFGSVERGMLKNYEPNCNVAFVYGYKQPELWFTPKWLVILSKNKKNEVMAADTGHWIQRDKPEIVINLIKKRAELS